MDPTLLNTLCSGDIWARGGTPLLPFVGIIGGGAGAGAGAQEEDIFLCCAVTSECPRLRSVSPLPYPFLVKLLRPFCLASLHLVHL